MVKTLSISPLMLSGTRMERATASLLLVRLSLCSALPLTQCVEDYGIGMSAEELKTNLVRHIGFFRHLVFTTCRNRGPWQSLELPISLRKRRTKKPLVQVTLLVPLVLVSTAVSSLPIVLRSHRYPQNRTRPRIRYNTYSVLVPRIVPLKYTLTPAEIQLVVAQRLPFTSKMTAWNTLKR